MIKKERIRNKALEENRYKQYVSEQYYKDFTKEAERIEKQKNEYRTKSNYQEDLRSAKHEANKGKARLDAWKRREKWLMDMNVDELSVRRMKKQTKLKFHEFSYPSEFENYQ